jgi:hypothetical protein
VPGDFAGARVCGWHASGTAIFLCTESPPVHVRRVDLATGAATDIAVLDPPPVGRRGIVAVAVSSSGDAYAYSYGQELSRLYAMSTGDAGDRAW